MPHRIYIVEGESGYKIGVFNKQGLKLFLKQFKKKNLLWTRDICSETNKPFPRHKVLMKQIEITSYPLNKTLDSHKIYYIKWWRFK